MYLKYKIKSLYWDLRARCQRFMRGYSYGDVWNMDDWFIRTLKPMLTHLRDYGCGVPLDFEFHEDQWNAILSEMIDCLKLMDEDNAKKHLGFNTAKDVCNMTIEDIRKRKDLMEKNKNRFFELFSKYFYNLWD